MVGPASWLCIACCAAATTSVICKPPTARDVGFVDHASYDCLCLSVLQGIGGAN